MRSSVRGPVLTKNQNRTPVSAWRAVSELRCLGIDEENPWFKGAEITARFGLDSISGAEAGLEKFRGIKARNYDVHEFEVSKFEGDLSLHQLYIQTLNNRPEHRSIFEAHSKAFDEIYERLSKMLDCRVLPLATQVRVQVAMILSGVEDGV